MQSCSQGALVFFLLSFGFRVGRSKGRFFFFQAVFGVERAGGEDLFSFQPIGGPKVPCFSSFFSVS